MTRCVSCGDCDIGALIRARRKELKVTQKQLACAAGCTSQQMQKYEYGYSKLSVQMFLRICSSLHTSPIYFLGSVSFLEGGGVIDRDVEARLLNIVRSIKNLKVKARVVELVEAVVSGSVDVADAE